MRKDHKSLGNEIKVALNQVKIFNLIFGREIQIKTTLKCLFDKCKAWQTFYWEDYGKTGTHIFLVEKQMAFEEFGNIYQKYLC